MHGDMKMENTKYLYHYTSLDTLALILKNKTICFNNLLYVDDIEESLSKDMGDFGKYINVSCWTAEEKESIALWNLYTPNMHGVRIRMPIFPFKKYKYHKGEYFLDNDIETFINIGRLYDDDKGSTTADQPKLIKVEYTDDDQKLYPKIKKCNVENAAEKYLSANSMEDLDERNLTITYSFNELGRFKRTDWSFQKEWRYIISFSPMGLKENYPTTFKKQQEQIRRIENLNQSAPYDKFFLDLDENAIREMKVLFGPKMTESEKILAKALLKENDLSSSWEESKLKIR